MLRPRSALARHVKPHITAHMVDALAISGEGIVGVLIRPGFGLA